jgi:hypothetical protein
MSETLGAIHHLLYNKVLSFDKLNESILNISNKNNWCKELEKDLNSKYNKLPEGKLEDILDLDNIHVWLEDKVDIVETRFAYIVTTLIKSNPKLLNEIKDIAYRFGELNFNINGINAIRNYEQIKSIMLDGMPCDKSMKVLVSNFKVVEITEVVPIHDKYWELVDGDIDNYHEIIVSIINGGLSKSNFNFLRVDKNTYSLKRD